MPVVRHSKPGAPKVPEIVARMLNGKTLETQSVKPSTLKVKALNSQSKQRKDYILPKGRILVQMDGKTLGEYQLSKPIYTIGRFPASDIQIPSQRVSRLHALIRWKNGAWVIEDAESLNGLTCRGQRIDRLALVDGDLISIDPTIVLQYYEESGQ